MQAHLIYPGLDCEFLDEHYRLVRGVIRLVHSSDNSADIELSTGEIRTIDCDKLRSQVYHPEGTGKHALKAVRKSRLIKMHFCATCKVMLTLENAAQSDVRQGGYCKMCRSLHNKARNRREETGE